MPALGAAPAGLAAAGLRGAAARFGAASFGGAALDDAFFPTGAFASAAALVVAALDVEAVLVAVAPFEVPAFAVSALAAPRGAAFALRFGAAAAARAPVVRLLAFAADRFFAAMHSHLFVIAIDDNGPAATARGRAAFHASKQRAGATLDGLRRR